MADFEIFDWFKCHQYDIVISVSNKKDPIAYCTNKSGNHFTATGKTVFEALNSLKVLIKDC